MFRSVLLLCLAALMLSLGACSDDDDNPTGLDDLIPDPSLLAGTWDLTGIRSQSSHGAFDVPASEIEKDPLVYIFSADGTGTTIYQGSTSTLSWTASGSILTAYGEGFNNDYVFGVSSTTLQLQFDVEDDVVYHITQTFRRR